MSTIDTLLDELDPTHRYSDDHRYWRKHNDIMKAIAIELSKLPFEQASQLLEAKLGKGIIYTQEQHADARQFYFDGAL